MTALYFSYLTDGFDLVDLTLDSKEFISAIMDKGFRYFLLEGSSFIFGYRVISGNDD